MNSAWLYTVLAVCLGIQLISSVPAHASSPCPLSTTNPSVTVCTPTTNALVQSPVNVVAGSTDSNTVTAMQIYVDNNLVTSAKAATINSFVTLSGGNHLITVQGWDSTGATFKTNVPVTMQPPCRLNGTNKTVTICSLANGSVVSQPFHVVAAANDSTPVTSMTLLIDNVPNSVIQNSAILDLYVSAMSLGSHTVAVQAKDSAGSSFSQSFNITVTAASKGLSNIGHIIFMVQENRSFDDYFGMLGTYRTSLNPPLPNNIDGLNLNTTLYTASGKPVHPYHYQTVCTDNVGVNWNNEHIDIDGGNMDKFIVTTATIPSNYDPEGTRTMGYYTQNELPYYYAAATQFATSDRFFSPVLTDTIPNRFYLFTGTSWGNVYPVNPPSGGFTQRTIFANLDQAGVSWRYYFQGSATSALIQQFSIYKTDSSKVVSISNWANDVKNDANLPSVIFIERSGPNGLDEHPTTNIQNGAADVANIITTLINSNSWHDSVFILTYDEAGNLYDHVPPAREIPPDKFAPILKSGDQPGAFNQSGFRVPLIVISPWVKPNFVSHTTRDYTSILRLIEDRFQVAPLTLRDANADNMMEFFDFSPTHKPVVPSLPPPARNGTCNHSLEAAPGF